MQVIFGDDDLDRLEIDGSYTANLSQALIKAYHSRINTIRQVVDEREFYALKSLHFKKLAGKRKHQYSMRLNDQYRLIIEFIESNSKSKIVKIVEIIDYHK